MCVCVSPTDHASDVLSGEGVAAAAAGVTDMDEVTVEGEDIAEATAAASEDKAGGGGGGGGEASGGVGGSERRGMEGNFRKSGVW